LITALQRLGVKQCTVVGFSYGGMVAFKMAEMNPDLVRSLVISGSVIAMTDSISDATLERLGMKSSSELLLPETVKGLKALQSLAMYRKIWFPNFLIKDYLEVSKILLLLHLSKESNTILLMFLFLIATIFFVHNLLFNENWVGYGLLVKKIKII
jgi:pimeloyl-ACP methyl ester carboxylesterase